MSNVTHWHFRLYYPLYKRITQLKIKVRFSAVASGLAVYSNVMLTFILHNCFLAELFLIVVLGEGMLIFYF